MSFETASRLNCKFAFAIKSLKITLPSGREFRVSQGAVFLTSPSPAHAAALAGLCRAIDETTDMSAPVEAGDKLLFVRYGARFFDIPYDNAPLAVRIELLKESAPSIIINAAAERPAPSPPAPITGFEFPH